MTSTYLYCCERCDYVSTSKNECLAHEASHFGLTLSDYDRWRDLTKAAESAGYVCGNCSNPETRKKFDDAIYDLVNFEQRHNLPDIRPKHF